VKILIVNFSDLEGGAARAAYRLHKSLLAKNIDSKMLVRRKLSDDFTVKTIGSNKLQKVISLFRPIMDSLPTRFYKKRTQTAFSPSWFGFSNIVNEINEIKPDIVHFHWICAGMIKIEDIEKITVPIVWSIHDMWPFTGGCHYDEECFGFKQDCQNCKVLSSGNRNLLSSIIFKRKQRIYRKKKDITIIGLSNWINESSKSSALFKHKRHVNLPNAIDSNIFKPFDKVMARKLWNLPKNKKLVLYGAMGATSDPRKGFKELAVAINKFTIIDDVEFVVFGGSEPKNKSDFEVKTHFLGSVGDDISLVTLYSAVDVVVVPSKQENLSNVIMESLSCGTPVVAFDIGGNCDMIEHKKTGYLAKSSTQEALHFDTDDLKYGIEWVLNNKDYDLLCRNARRKVLKEFDSVIVSKKYIDVYQDILKRIN